MPSFRAGRSGGCCGVYQSISDSGIPYPILRRDRMNDLTRSRRSRIERSRPASGKLFLHSLEQCPGQLNSFGFAVLVPFIFNPDVAMVAGLDDNSHHAVVVRADFLTFVVEFVG